MFRKYPSFNKYSHCFILQWTQRKLFQADDRYHFGACAWQPIEFKSEKISKGSNAVYQIWQCKHTQQVISMGCLWGRVSSPSSLKTHNLKNMFASREQLI